MVKEELCPGIVVYKNALEDPNSLLESIEFAIESGVVDWNPPYVNDGTRDYIDRDHRDVDVIAVPFPKHERNFFEENIMETVGRKEIFDFFIGDTLKKGFDLYLNDYRNFYSAENFHEYDDFQILKYGNGQHFGNHVDDSIMYQRRISMSYYLNNDFDGGEIEFPRFNIKYKPEGNDLLLFPSSYVYNHKVYPVTNGTRYTVVNWVH